MEAVGAIKSAAPVPSNNARRSISELFDEDAADDTKTTTTLSLTEEMRGKRAQEKSEDLRPLSDAEKALARSQNPFVPGPNFNLTKSMTLMRRSPEFAAELQRYAAA